ncbi:MAG: glycosyltransferase [Anaerolineaceae bacterium]|nr:glycosyltransferase [Anaerolineaceae bacterium]
MKVLFLCGRAPGYPRNQSLRSTLNHFGDVDLVAPKLLTRSIIARSAISYLEATRKLITNRYDLIFVGFFGQLLAPPIAALKKAPILFDAFISAYDTLVFDRETIRPHSIFAKLIFALDRASCNVSNRVLLDTKTHIQYFVNTFELSEAKFDAIPVGCDDNLFVPRNLSRVGGDMIVLFYGSFLPVHGLEIIVKAAKLLESRPITFRIIGEGMKYKEIIALASEIKVNNVTFVPSVPLSSLPDEISSADICLGGHFGHSEKAKRVVSGKTYQCISMAKPTIVGDNEANCELLTHNYDAWFCKMGDPLALAEAVRKLADDPNLRKKIATNARDTYLKKASQKILNTMMKEVLEKIRE